MTRAGERVPCVVPFCRRTHKPFANGDDEWICEVHWRLCTRTARRVYHHRRRIAHRMPPGYYEAKIAPLWNTLKRQAIEGAAGL